MLSNQEGTAKRKAKIAFSATDTKLEQTARDAIISMLKKATEAQGRTKTIPFNPGELFVCDSSDGDAVTTAARIAGDGSRVALFVLDMTAEDVAARVLSISLASMRNGDMTNEEFERLVVASQRMHWLPLYINDTVRTMRGMRLAAAAIGDLCAIVIQRMSLMQIGDGESVRDELEAMAKGLGVPVIAFP